MSDCCGGCAEGSSYIINVAPCLSGCSGSACPCPSWFTFDLYTEYNCEDKKCEPAWGTATATPNDCTYTGMAEDTFGDEIPMGIFPPNSTGRLNVSKNNYWMIMDAGFDYYSLTEGCDGLMDDYYSDPPTDTYWTIS